METEAEETSVVGPNSWSGERGEGNKNRRGRGRSCNDIRLCVRSDSWARSSLQS